MNKAIITVLLILSCILGFYVYNELTQKESEIALVHDDVSADHLTASEFNKELATGKYVLIDIRTQEEYIDGHIKGSVQKDFYQTEEFKKYLNSLDREKGYLIYCRSAKRSGAALEMMKEMGFTDVKDLTGGYNAWISQNLPIEK